MIAVFFFKLFYILILKILSYYGIFPHKVIRLLNYSFGNGSEKYQIWETLFYSLQYDSLLAVYQPQSTVQYKHQTHKREARIRWYSASVRQSAHSRGFSNLHLSTFPSHPHLILLMHTYSSHIEPFTFSEIFMHLCALLLCCHHSFYL